MRTARPTSLKAWQIWCFRYRLFSLRSSVTQETVPCCMGPGSGGGSAPTRSRWKVEVLEVADPGQQIRSPACERARRQVTTGLAYQRAPAAAGSRLILQQRIGQVPSQDVVLVQAAVRPPGCRAVLHNPSHPGDVHDLGRGGALTGMNGEDHRSNGSRSNAGRTEGAPPPCGPATPAAYPVRRHMPHAPTPCTGTARTDCGVRVH